VVHLSMGTTSPLRWTPQLRSSITLGRNRGNNTQDITKVS